MADQRKAKPGSRKGYDAPGFRAGHFSEERYAWCKVEIGQFVILVTPEDQSDEFGNDVLLHMPRERSHLTLRLTDLKKEELDVVREIITTALDWAEPIVEMRDKEAADAWAAGDDTVRRGYRQVPTKVYRKRLESEHGQGVHDRSENVPSGSWGGLPGYGGIRGLGEGMVEHDSGKSKAENDAATTD